MYITTYRMSDHPISTPCYLNLLRRALNHPLTMPYRWYLQHVSLTSEISRMVWSLPATWATSRLRGFQFSTLTSSEPHNLPPPSLLSVSLMARTPLTVDQSRATYGSRPQIMPTWSSDPLARYRPLCAQRTVKTAPKMCKLIAWWNSSTHQGSLPVCSDIVHRSFSFASTFSASELRIGTVDQILIFLSNLDQLVSWAHSTMKEQKSLSNIELRTLTNTSCSQPRPIRVNR